jgi:peptidoglycan/LPS O-acetylase OafA/YrhL
MRTALPTPKGYFSSIDLLRGAAALAVGLFHLSTGFLQEGNPLRFIFQHGHLGVEFFFVISGFIIPYTLWKKDHQLRDFPRFMLARLLRLHPAYLGSVTLMLLTLWLPNFLPPPFHQAIAIDWTNVGLHFWYLSALAGKPWLNGVYWSLAIEMQYYLLLGIGFALLARAPKPATLLALGLFAASAFWCPPTTVFYYAGLFLPGILLFLWHIGRLRQAELLVLVLANALLLYWQRHDYYRPGAVLAACAFIRFVRWQHPLGAYFGRISYSFYLLHTTVAFAFLGLLVPYVHNETARTLLVLAAIGLATLAAAWYYRLVEAPTQQLAKQVGSPRGTPAS